MYVYLDTLVESAFEKDSSPEIAILFFIRAVLFSNIPCSVFYFPVSLHFQHRPASNRYMTHAGFLKITRLPLSNFPHHHTSNHYMTHSGFVTWLPIVKYFPYKLFRILIVTHEKSLSRFAIQQNFYEKNIT